QFQQAADASKPKPKEKSPFVVLREATSFYAQKHAKLEKASKALIAAEAWLADAKSRQLAAAEYLFVADQARFAAQEAARGGPAGIEKTEPPTDLLTAFGVDPSLFQLLDEYKEDDRQKQQALQKQVQDVTVQAKAREQELKDLPAFAKAAASASRKKRRAEDGAKVGEAPAAVGSPEGGGATGGSGEAASEAGAGAATGGAGTASAEQRAK
ncbi:unnamed protein product, partial [Prorocentrum cordatum]